MSETEKQKEDELTVLKRKLAQTEARILIRLLTSAQQALPPEQFELLWRQYKDNASLDLLDMERSIATAATTLSENLYSLYEAVKDFRAAQMKMNDFERGFWEEGSLLNPQEIANELLMTRERMFSLVDEYDLKLRFNRQNLME